MTTRTSKWRGRVAFGALVLAVVGLAAWGLATADRPRSGPPAEPRHLLIHYGPDGFGVMTPDGEEVLPPIYQIVRLWQPTSDTDAESMTVGREVISEGMRPMIQQSIGEAARTVWIVTERVQRQRRFIRQWPFMEWQSEKVYEILDSSGRLFLTTHGPDFDPEIHWPVLMTDALYVVEPTGIRPIPITPDPPVTSTDYVKLGAAGHLQVNGRLYGPTGNCVIDAQELEWMDSDWLRRRLPGNDDGQWDIVDLNGTVLLGAPWQLLHEAEDHLALVGDGSGRLFRLYNFRTGKWLEFRSETATSWQRYSAGRFIGYVNHYLESSDMDMEAVSPNQVLWTNERIAVQIEGHLSLYTHDFELIKVVEVQGVFRATFLQDSKRMGMVEGSPTNDWAWLGQIVGPTGDVTPPPIPSAVAGDFIVGRGPSGYGLMNPDGSMLLPADYSSIVVQRRPLIPYAIAQPHGLPWEEQFAYDTARIIGQAGEIGLIDGSGRWLAAPQRILDAEGQPITAPEFAIVGTGDDGELLLLHRDQDERLCLNDGPPLLTDQLIEEAAIFACHGPWIIIIAQVPDKAWGFGTRSAVYLYHRERREWADIEALDVRIAAPGVILLATEAGHVYMGPDGEIWRSADAARREATGP